MSLGEILTNRAAYKLTFTYLMVMTSIILNSEMKLTKRLLTLFHP